MLSIKMLWLRRMSSVKLLQRNSLKAALENGPKFDDFVVGTADNAVQGDFTASNVPGTGRLPKWLKTPIAVGQRYTHLKDTLRDLKLHTVCEEAKCPNIGDCWNGGETGKATATIMLMGDECTRGCRFCSVKTSKAPKPLDPLEPERTAIAISKWGLDYVVLTSVDRDDLIDGGAGHFAETIKKIKEMSNDRILVECLTGDFGGNLKGVEMIMNAGPNVYAHNLETVERLTPSVRDYRAKYHQSLEVLRYAKLQSSQQNNKFFTKSSLMLGCGETFPEVIQAMKDLRSVGTDFLTIGQYMRPTKRHMKVEEYVAPEIFEKLEKIGLELGFKYVASGPLVRSSYRAGELFIKSLFK